MSSSCLPTTTTTTQNPRNPQNLPLSTTPGAPRRAVMNESAQSATERAARRRAAAASRTSKRREHKRNAIEVLAFPAFRRV
jgi:hypothetical protein